MNSEEGSELERRVLLKLLTVIGGAAAAPTGSLERLAELAGVVERAGPVDGPLLDAMEELTARYAAQFEVVPPQPLLELVIAHVNHLGARLDRPMAPSLRARLGAVTAESAALAGWLAYLVGRRGEARSWFSFARDAARDADHPLLHALALGSMAALFSAVSSAAPGGSMVAVRLLQQALALVPYDAPATTRAWLAGRLATEQALLGDFDGFARNLARSGAALAQATEGGRTGVFTHHAVLSFWGPGGIGWEHAAGFGGAVLGDRHAVDRLAPALDAVPSDVGRSNVLVDLATAHLHLDDPERCAALAAEGLHVAAAGGYAGRTQRIAYLRERLPQGTPGAAELDELLATTG